MKKILKIVLIVLAVAFVVAQFIRPDQVNPAINPAETLDASVAVPDNVSAILQRSCSDCHTNTTAYPWYSQISPFSWFLNNHIQDGRRELNWSVWNTYSAKKKSKKLEEVCEQVKTGEMPLPSYLWIHRDAVMQEGDANILCDWANQVRQTIQ
ncbi:MAG: heme-binding domain-containing protein [Acidobacteriota bacterium]